MEETKGHTVLEDLRLASKLFTGNGMGATDLDVQWIQSKKLNRWGREVRSSQGTGMLMREEAVSSPLHYLLCVRTLLAPCGMIVARNFNIFTSMNKLNSY